VGFRRRHARPFDEEPDLLPAFALMSGTRTMSYAALMVHFDDLPNARQRARLAADLAARFDALLIGISGYLYLPSFLSEVSAAGSVDDERQEMAQLLADIGGRFRMLAKHASMVEWRGTIAFGNDLVAREARSADLVIVGRKQDPADLFYSLDPGVCIIRTGRPVLLVPDEIASLHARRVMVAWKDSREARRAVRDALPFIKEAEQVMVVTVCEHGTEMQAQKSIDDLTKYLLRHTVEVAERACLHTTQSVAGELLRFVGDENADLIVAGGYGHSRFGEWVLGGVTRDLLAKSPVCCLFAH
jgi:nucleotide-binding universal stress UspA family protein